MIQIGDHVTWTHVMRSGKWRVRLSTREGTVQNVSRGLVYVTYRGRLLYLTPERLRLKGQRTELTEMVMEGVR